MTLDAPTLKLIVDDLTAAVDNEVWRQRDYQRGIPERRLQELARAVRQAIREALQTRKMS